MKNIMVTGGAGYIGTHVVSELLLSNFNVIVVDNFCKGSRAALNVVQTLMKKRIHICDCDVRDASALTRILVDKKVDAVLHLAGLKSVLESALYPTAYYENNLGGTLSLVRSMRAADVNTMIFSSSATVYGEANTVPVTEGHPTNPTSPYGNSKLFVEKYLKELCSSDRRWKIGVLRYFNPVGAHKSGLIGEELSELGSNLMPQLGLVALGKKSSLQVFGADYPTQDGTGVRDYIHISDLASGHLKALVHVASRDGGFEYWNLGTGRGYSVLEMINSFQKMSKRLIPYNIVERRPGDISESVASVVKSREQLNWSARRGLDEMCEDSWRWYSKNPSGYDG